MVSTANKTGRHCKAVNARGLPCGGYATAGSDFCFAHDPDRAKERKAARSKGGYARHGRQLLTAGDLPESFRTIADVTELLECTVKDALTLENSIARARAVGYLAGILFKALEVGDLEERIAELERLRGTKE